MCYLRNFLPIENNFHLKESIISNQAFQTKIQDESFQNSNCFLNIFKNIGSPYAPSFESDLLTNLLKLAQKNSKAIENISEKIEQNDFMLSEISGDEETLKKVNKNHETCSDTDDSSLEQGSGFRSEQLLTKKLFGGNKQYKFRLVLDEGFPEQVFKERNFNFSVKLVDMKGNKVRNSNIIHLCLGVCNVNGEWVTETKAKQPFMKGKTQSELYHGQASYTKIFSRDVSRCYPDGKLNLVVYPKQSALKYCHGSNTLEQAVRSFQIEPLVIKDLSIKAKKKEAEKNQF